MLERSMSLEKLLTLLRRLKDPDSLTEAELAKLGIHLRKRGNVGKHFRKRIADLRRRLKAQIINLTRPPRPLPPPRTYGERDGLLRRLGLGAYVEYLSSPLWMAIRTRMLSLHDGKCCLCGNQAGVVHHLHYTEDNLRGLNLRGLYPLCHSCHRKVEFGRDGRKRDLQWSQRVFQHYWSKIDKAERREFHKRSRKG